MSLESWLSYVAVLLVFMATPGPSHLLMLANSVTNGAARAMATAGGDLSANTLQILAAALGLAGLTILAQGAFEVVKWAGVAYLVWLGIAKIRNASRHAARATTPRASLRQLYWQGFITSAANPKAVIFFAALLPQFIDHGQPLAAQFALLGATYIIVDGAFLSAYAIASAPIGRFVRGRWEATVERAAGGGFILAALLLAGKRIAVDAR
ncbi:LysE family translocator [Tepidamorphus sp. 3E244]|uniref:LysE family translocator n=1 Tax=Tepidamorphus sp. 3E244 TaxID=3385498 RepID=UPI0038FCAD8E